MSYYSSSYPKFYTATVMRFFCVAILHISSERCKRSAKQCELSNAFCPQSYEKQDVGRYDNREELPVQHMVQVGTGEVYASCPEH
jgi:hypothetical protein